jgi:hypothetical protein
VSRFDKVGFVEMERKTLEIENESSEIVYVLLLLMMGLVASKKSIDERCTSRGSNGCSERKL